MAKIICVDGLGGNPSVTFKELNYALRVKHDVVILDTTSVSTHEDRVNLVIDEYSNKTESQVFLLGHSAGGSAVRIAAERIERDGKRLSGVVQLSPAMPFGVFFLTKTLAGIMRGRLAEILLGQMIYPTEVEYGTLMAPMAQDIEDEIIKSRQTISGKEARALALYPPVFVGYKFPTLHIFGSEDRWIATRAQKRLHKKLRKKSPVKSFEIIGAGHLTLASENRKYVIGLIQQWIDSMGNQGL